MSDVYDAPDIGDPENFMTRRAQAQAQLALEASPDDAARAIDLGKATGIPSPVVASDMERIDNQYKSKLTSGIIDNNQFIRDYINAHPLAAAVSNDDYGQLDAASGAIAKVGQKGFVENTGDIVKGIWHGLASGPEEYKQIAAGSEDFLLKLGMEPGAAKREAANISSRAYRNEELTNLLFAIPSLALSPVQGAFRTYAAQPLERNFGVPVQVSEGLGVALAGWLGLAGGLKAQTKLTQTAEKVAPYVKNGEIPPPGIDSIVDKIHTEQAKADKDALNDALKESAASATRDRAPDLFAEFARSHDSAKGNIGIAADAIRGLYGDKVPEPDDGILGWVPDLQAKLEAAEATGGDVEVPLADYLAKVEPEIHKELVDHVRVRPGGLTVEEGKNLKEEQAAIEAFHGTPHTFEAFDSKAIGTGEGAQSYGYGHYLAEAPEVAKSYADAGRINEATAAKLQPEDRKLLGELIGKTPEEMSEILEGSATQEQQDRIMAVLNEAKPSLLQVRIHRRPEEFLDWDKPFKDQPVGVQSAIEEAGIDPVTISSGEHAYRELSRASRRTLTADEKRGVYPPGIDVTTTGPVQASELLAKHGIAGIRYLDQRSREPRAEKEAHISNIQHALKNNSNLEPETRAQMESQIKEIGAELDKPLTSNYVVFNDKDLEVISRNGEALKAMRQAAGLEPSPPTEMMKEGEKPTTEAKQLELPQEGTTRLEDRKPFAGPPPGFTKQMYDLYLKKIAERRADDADWLSKRFLEFQRKTQSAEWKANRAEMRPGIKDEIEAQPVVAADKLLRDGDVKLSAEHGEGLPPEWLAKEGIHPDDLAGLLGHDTGAELLAELRGMVNARGDTPAAAFLKEMIDHTTDQRMMEKFGDLDKNIISEAKDQVLSGIQEEILHQETMARAAEAGLQFSIPPDQLRAAVVRHFNQLPISAVTSDKFLADAGRAGRKAEVAGLKGDAAGAFREAQRREFAFIAAREARKVEKEIKGFDRTAKRFSDREVKGVDQEYTNWIHQILLRVGKPVKRSLQDLGDSIGRMEHQKLGEFTEYKESHGLREVPVADFLKDDSWKKDYDSLTVEEFRALKDSVKALEHNGREEAAIYKGGEAADLANIKSKMLEQIKSFKEKTFDPSGKIVQPFSGTRRAFRTALVSHLQAETVMNRLDHFDPKGVFSQYVFRPLAAGANDEAQMLREFSKKLGDLAYNGNLRERVPNNIFTEPFKMEQGEGVVEYGPPMAMTKKNLLTILLNHGNESNAFKMARGYGLDPATVKDWLFTNTTKEDWEWASRFGREIFSDLKGRSDTMYRSLSGIEPESLQIKPVETPHGTFPGWYYPLIRHATFSDDVKLFKDGLEGQGYVRATTPAGYTKARTGAIYPLSLDMDSLPNQLRQVIHDIALRPAVLQAAKIFYDKSLMAQMKRHLGPEYADMFVPWLRDVANVQNFTSSAQKSMARFSDFMRQNAVTTLVGFNPGTALKHTPTALISSMAEVGPMNFLKALRSMVSINEETGDKNWRFAISQSEELQRRSRNWSETMGGGLAQLEGRTLGQSLVQRDYGSAFMSLREAITELSSKPVALGDLISAVPTWIAKYESEMGDHGIHGDAVAGADKAVRQAHGSSAITSRSAVARSQSGLTKWFTGFFTFFNDLFNRQVETIWRAGEIKGMVNEGRHTEAMKESANIAGRMFAYVIAPAMIEELVTPLANTKDESWAKTAGKALLFTLSSSWVGVRDLVSAYLNGRDPSAGLVTTSLKSVSDFLRDFSSRKGVKVDNVIKHGTQLSGMLTGLTPAPIGRAAEFGNKVREGVERPKGPWGWLVGLRYGTTKGHSQTFDQYMKGK